MTGIVVDASAAKTYLSIYDFDTDADLLREILPMAIRQEHPVGPIKPRFSKTEGGSYLSNGCFECGALQGRFFEHHYVNDATVRHGSTTVVAERWRRLLARRFSRHRRLLDIEPTRFAGDSDGFIGDDDDD